MLVGKPAFVTTFYCSHRPSTHQIPLLRACHLYHTSSLSIYTKLNHARSEIRVLQLKPGRWDERISCRLKVVSLDRLFKPSYDTLSYTWGSSADPRIIGVNQQDTAVSANLFTALRALRRRHRTVTIWADALCIDQSNNDEKSKQVALMGRIYKRGRQTWVSLGCPDELWANGTWSPPSRLPGIREVFKQAVRRMWRAVWHHIVLRRSLSSRRGVNHISDSLRLLQSTHLAKFLDEPLRQDVKEAKSMLTWLATHEYWSRVWIAQEIALSKIDPICLYGRHQVPLLSLDTVFSDWSDGGFLSSPDAHSQRPSWSPAISQGLARAQEICMLRDEYLSMRQSIRARHLTGSIDLSRMLQLASHRNATVPHDYVYGLRSLLPSKDQASLIPDYSLSIRELYAAATKLLVQKTGSANLLCAVVGTSAGNAHGLPSWAFDFSKPLRLPTRNNTDSITNDIRAMNAIETDSFDVLYLRGTRLKDTITTSVPHNYLSAELGSNEIVSTFMQDFIYSQDSRMNNAYDDPQPMSPDSYHYFMTSDHSLGKCANEVQERDELWNFEGSVDVFVLRPLLANGMAVSETRDKRYRLVGPCAMLRTGGENVHGMMEHVQIV